MSFMEMIDFPEEYKHILQTMRDSFSWISWRPANLIDVYAGPVTDGPGYKVVMGFHETNTDAEARLNRIGPSRVEGKGKDALHALTAFSAALNAEYGQLITKLKYDRVYLGGALQELKRRCAAAKRAKKSPA